MPPFVNNTVQLHHNRLAFVPPHKCVGCDSCSVQLSTDCRNTVSGLFWSASPQPSVSCINSLLLFNNTFVTSHTLFCGHCCQEWREVCGPPSEGNTGHPSACKLWAGVANSVPLTPARQDHCTGGWGSTLLTTPCLLSQLDERLLLRRGVYASFSHTSMGILRKAALRNSLQYRAMVWDAAGFTSLIISSAFWLRNWFIASPEQRGSLQALGIYRFSSYFVYRVTPPKFWTWLTMCLPQPPEHYDAD